MSFSLTTPQFRAQTKTVTRRKGWVFLNPGDHVLGIEKGMGLSIPGFVPGTLGEIYEYIPSLTEKLVALGVLAIGAMVYTLLLKFAIPVYTGELKFYSEDKPVAIETVADSKSDL